jgi:hypothetical protein
VGAPTLLAEFQFALSELVGTANLNREYIVQSSTVVGSGSVSGTLSVSGTDRDKRGRSRNKSDGRVIFHTCQIYSCLSDFDLLVANAGIQSKKYSRKETAKLPKLGYHQLMVQEQQRKQQQNKNQ